MVPSGPKWSKTINHKFNRMAFITRFNLVLVWSNILQIFTKKSSKWFWHNQVSWSSYIWARSNFCIKIKLFVTYLFYTYVLHGWCFVSPTFFLGLFNISLSLFLWKFSLLVKWIAQLIKNSTQEECSSIAPKGSAPTINLIAIFRT